MAFLGQAKYAKAAVQALSTPGVEQAEAKPLSFDCSEPIHAG
ncbi:hypothetical protein P9139_07535 [Curtobacterium flaccumfaciens]|nr:hypothetical protein P9139_07535 [Curtobacterium flaccumfaciens]